ncbi:hypothetical protein B0H17DRAFT_1335523 [Mycena rosella]|uniref:Uncharacterized protein n=1 Tax=Mycena rosella TaxID=1033263 RepID=A0AAD7G9X2_MYCRO|nr:hypothetical protein B0H17DRAFT_1335523 [Mycena rosella]
MFYTGQQLQGLSDRAAESIFTMGSEDCVVMGKVQGGVDGNEHQDARANYTAETEGGGSMQRAAGVNRAEEDPPSGQSPALFTPSPEMQQTPLFMPSPVLTHGETEIEEEISGLTPNLNDTRAETPREPIPDSVMYGGQASFREEGETGYQAFGETDALHQPYHEQEGAEVIGSSGSLSGSGSSSDLSSKEGSAEESSESSVYELGEAEKYAYSSSEDDGLTPLDALRMARIKRGKRRANFTDDGDVARKARRVTGILHEAAPPGKSYEYAKLLRFVHYKFASLAGLPKNAVFLAGGKALFDAYAATLDARRVKLNKKARSPDTWVF